MKEIHALLQRPSIWLRHDGPEADIVLSTRIRFARNVAGRPFPQRAEPTLRAEILRDILESTQNLEPLDGDLRLPLEPLGALERRLLGERQLLSQDLVESPRYRAVVIGADESLSFMVNEEDHLRIQALQSGYDLKAAFQLAEKLEAALAQRVDFAFSPTFGFLTACPTNAGTGMRASVLMHLPGLVYGKKAEAELEALREHDVTVRGFHGEGTAAMGNFFQVSNSITLGVHEHDILERIGKVVSRLLERERTARDELLDGARTLLEDRIWRSFGILSHARRLSSQETLHHASLLRLGRAVGFLEISEDVLNDVLTWSQEAHTELLSARDGDDAERAVWRANEIRKKLRSSKS